MQDEINNYISYNIEKETGIKVNYSTYDTNEIMYQKVKTNPGTYDLVVPSDYMIEKMIEEGIDTFIEIGPSKTLSSFVKEISRNKKANLNIFNVEDLKSLDKTLEGVEIKC